MAALQPSQTVLIEVFQLLSSLCSLLIGLVLNIVLQAHIYLFFTTKKVVFMLTIRFHYSSKMSGSGKANKCLLTGQPWNYICVLKYPKQIGSSMTVGKVVFLVMKVTDATRGMTKQPSVHFCLVCLWNGEPRLSWHLLTSHYLGFSFVHTISFFVLLFKSNFHLYQTKTTLLSVVLSASLGWE